MESLPFTYRLQVSDSSLSQESKSTFLLRLSQSFRHRDNSESSSVPSMTIVCSDPDEVWAIADEVFGSRTGIELNRIWFMDEVNGEMRQHNTPPFPLLQNPLKDSWNDEG